MRIIIAGSRSITSYAAVVDAMREALSPTFSHSCLTRPTEIVSGCAPGVDTLGELWAGDHGVKIKRFPAIWRAEGVYNPDAGYERNEQMAEYADALVAVWDGKSGGTKDMILRMNKRGKPYFVWFPYNKTARASRKSRPVERTRS